MPPNVSRGKVEAPGSSPLLVEVRLVYLVPPPPVSRGKVEVPGGSPLSVKVR